MRTHVREASTTITVEEHSIICGCGPCHDHKVSIEGWAPSFDSQNGDSVSGINDVLGSSVSSSISLGAAQFDFAVEVVDKAGGTSKADLDAFVAVAEKAMATWASYISGASGAKIEVQLNVGGTSAVASAGPGSLLYGEKIDVNGSGKFDKGDFVVVESGVLRELTTGKDPNGSGADIVINVNENLINNGDFFFDPTLSKDVPAGMIDFYSVLLHEIAHGLGFLGLSGGGSLPIGYFATEGGQQIQAEYGTLYDYWGQGKDSNGNPVFEGPNAIKAYGDALRLEYTTGSSGSDFSHFLGGKANDLKFTLMNPYVVRGDRVEVGNVELAVLKDLGYDVVNNAPGFGNHVDKIAKTALPVFKMDSGYSVSGTTISLDVTISKTAPLGKAATSVAYEVVGPNGKVEMGRIYFSGSDTKETISIDGAKLFGTGLKNFDGSLEIRLYNPMHGKLGNGKQSEKFEVSGDGTKTADPTPEPTPEPAPAPEPTGTNTITGTNNNDDIIGTKNDDIIDGQGGSDNLVGGAGDDRLIGGGGWDVLNGDNADGSLVNDRNTFVVGKGKDTIVNFEVGADTLEVDAAYNASTNTQASALAAVDDTLSSEAELLNYFEMLLTDNNTATDVQYSKGVITVQFDDRHQVTINRTVASSDFFKKLNALIGGETVSNPTEDPPTTSDGEIITGTSSRDTLNGTSGDDTIDGKAGTDKLTGGAGNDRLIGGGGWDILNGDFADGRLADDENTFVTGIGKDTIVNFEVGKDTLEIEGRYASMSSSKLAKLDRMDDAIKTEAQLLEYFSLLKNDGVAGTDISWDGNNLVISFNKGRHETTISNLVASRTFKEKLSEIANGQAVEEPTDGEDPVTGPVEGASIDGTEGWDELRGTEGDDVIDGRGGNDLLIGGEGNDRLVGGAGWDILNGDDANGSLVNDQNTFVVGVGRDRIVNFEVGKDTLEIDASYSSSSRNDRKALEALDNSLSSEAEFLDYLRLMKEDGSQHTDWSWDGRSLSIDFEDANHGVRIINLVASNSFKQQLADLSGSSASISIADEDMQSMLSLDPDFGVGGAEAAGSAQPLPEIEPIELHMFGGFNPDDAEAQQQPYFDHALVA
jgi:Ca2+-binding RTX toxin-like protein